MAKAVGRPSSYDPKYDRQAYKLCLLGATDKQIADFFGVAEQTINNWKNDYPSFLESLKKGKDKADAEIAHSLYHRAKGYQHAEDKVFCSAAGQVTIVPTIKHYAPDTTACIFWLKNRQKEDWRDRQEIAVADFPSPFELFEQAARAAGNPGWNTALTKPEEEKP